MMTLRRLNRQLRHVPTAISWYLADLGEARGKQELFTRQSPQRLKALREHALIESAVSSNRIEGVNIDPSRARAVLLGNAALRDRDEEEVRGYREGLQLIHERGPKLPVSEATVLRLHRLARAGMGDAGKYKEKEGDIIEKNPDGTIRIRFKTVPSARTPAAMKELLGHWRDGLEERAVHPLILLAAFNLDFLCIHPFRDGNGRVSRLLALLQCYHLGYEVGRYISLERLIEQNRERYYETLEQSSRGWHEGTHDPWPYIGYALYILKEAYREFEARLGKIPSPRGEKTATVVRAIREARSEFRISDLQRRCPGVSVDMIRKVLKDLRAEGRLQCLGRGQAARWRRMRGWGNG